MYFKPLITLRESLKIAYSLSIFVDIISKAIFNACISDENADASIGRDDVLTIPSHTAAISGSLP